MQSKPSESLIKDILQGLSRSIDPVAAAEAPVSCDMQLQPAVSHQDLIRIGWVWITPISRAGRSIAGF